jgi:hypothetical protein
MKNLTEINYPNNSKIWIFSSNKPLNFTQTEIVSSRLKNFLKNWISHGKKLKSDFMILYNYFIIVLVDENSEKWKQNHKSHKYTEPNQNTTAKIKHMPTYNKKN